MHISSSLDQVNQALASLRRDAQGGDWGSFADRAIEIGSFIRSLGENVREGAKTAGSHVLGSRDEDVRLPSVRKTAALTESEKLDLIDEAHGNKARNHHKLDLTGTHYEQEDDFDIVLFDLM